MVLVRYDKNPPNKTLEGQKLLITLGEFSPSTEEIDAVKQKYPDLDVQVGQKKDITKEEWKDVTILLTTHNREGLPDKDDVPNLQYVQLSSAGANLIVTDPLYTDTDVAFCTANGVHGCVVSRVPALFLSCRVLTRLIFPDLRYRNGSSPPS